MKKTSFQSVVYREGKYFVAQCLDIDVSSFGKTQPEALANLTEALELYLEDKTGSELHQVDSPKLVRLSLDHA
ncbi:MAG TPA: type II toxin-antitoxin system HicB family antitoxin [Candidatus Saccharimonadales bacterium]|nr:type II toxin-antitoxin system HicB family antitoxin [Candidatus Saccharimonadales bacterium]